MRYALVSMAVWMLLAGRSAAEERSESVALGLSAGGAAASAVLVTVAIVDNGDHDGLGAIAGVVTLVTPSMGHWYAGAPWSRGLTLRIAGGAALGVGYLALLGKCTTHGDPGDGCDKMSDGVLFLGPGAAAVAAGVVYDVVTARRTVRRRNERRRQLVVAPYPAGGLTVSVVGGF